MEKRHNSLMSSFLIAAALVAGGVLFIGAGPAADGDKLRPARGGAVADHAVPSLHSASHIARGAQTTPNAAQLAMSSTGQAEAGQPPRLPRGG